MGQFGKELIESLGQAVDNAHERKNSGARVTTWQREKVQKGIAAADHNDFASDEEVAHVRAKFTVR
jgi:hypothetical protein